MKGMIGAGLRQVFEVWDDLAICHVRAMEEALGVELLAELAVRRH